MYFNRFVLRIIFAKKQLAIFLIMLVSTFLLMLFFLFFKTFTKYYIEELKLVYPTVYLIKEKKIDNYYLDNLQAYAEIFELNIDNFSVSFDSKENFTLGSLGIRSFPKSHIPKALHGLYEKGEILYLSHKIYRELSSNAKFQKELYLKSDVDSKVYKLRVKEFSLHDNSKWILLENSTAAKLFRDNFFNKASFYSKEDDSALEKRLSKAFKNIIYTWDEHISLVSRALKESMMYLFSWLTAAIAILSISSIVFFTRELADDLTHLTKHAFFYGISLKFVYFSYLLITNGVLILIVVTAYVLAYLANNFISLSLLSLPSYSERLFLVYLVATIFLVTSLGIYFGLRRLYYSKVYGLSRV